MVKVIKHLLTGMILQVVLKSLCWTTQLNDTVDGSEIQGSRVEVGSWNPIIDRVSYIQTVVQEFWTINSMTHLDPLS